MHGSPTSANKNPTSTQRGFGIQSDGQRVRRDQHQPTMASPLHQSHKVKHEEARHQRAVAYLFFGRCRLDYCRNVYPTSRVVPIVLFHHLVASAKCLPALGISRVGGGVKGMGCLVVRSQPHRSTCASPKCLRSEESATYEPSSRGSLV